MRRGRLSLLAAGALALAGCGAPPPPAGPVIVVTTTILGDVAQQVLGEQAVIETLMPPGADPHSHTLSAQDALLLDEAELVLSNGLGLEEGLQQHLDRARDAGVRTLVAGDVITVLPYSAGDASGTPDPHFWTDPAAMSDVVDALERAARDIPDIDGQRLAQSADAYRDRLLDLDREMSTAFGALPPERRALVTNHHVFGYLAARFDFRLVGTVIPGGTTLAAPSAADLRSLSRAITGAGVSTIFADSSAPDRLMQVLASEAGLHVQVRTLHTESLTGTGGDAATYLDMMRSNTASIVAGLSS